MGRKSGVSGLELESDGLALFGAVLGTDPALFQLLQLSLRFPYPHLYFAPLPAPHVLGRSSH